MYIKRVFSSPVMWENRKSNSSKLWTISLDWFCESCSMSQVWFSSRSNDGNCLSDAGWHKSESCVFSVSLCRSSGLQTPLYRSFSFWANVFGSLSEEIAWTIFATTEKTTIWKSEHAKMSYTRLKALLPNHLR